MQPTKNNKSGKNMQTNQKLFAFCIQQKATAFGSKKRDTIIKPLLHLKKQLNSNRKMQQ
uniref:Uncharacterized protein n=1 Tax=Rhizophora mucronata TaxID=61149 RepID=A0A2P2P1Q3_RHIMU